MSEAYVAARADAPAVHTLSDGLTPQTIYEALVGLRDARQRAKILHRSVAHYRLDRRLRSGRVVAVAGDVRGDRAFLSLVVRLADGTHRAVAVVVDRTARVPVVQAEIL